MKNREYYEQTERQMRRKLNLKRRGKIKRVQGLLIMAAQDLLTEDTERKSTETKFIGKKE